MNIVVPDFTEADKIYQSIGGIIPMDLDLGRDDPTSRDEYIVMVGEQYKEAKEILEKGVGISSEVKESLESFIETAIGFIEKSLSVKGFEELKRQYD